MSLNWNWLESLNCQQIPPWKGWLCRDYKEGVILDTCVLYSSSRPGREEHRTPGRMRKAQLSPCLPPSLALQAKTVLKVSKVLYLKSLTSKGRTLGEYVSSHYELFSSNKSSWHFWMLETRALIPLKFKKKSKQSNSHTLYHHQIYKFKIYSGKIQC